MTDSLTDVLQQHVRQTRKDGRVVSGQRVLVVDGLSETEEVLKAVLEPRGLQVERVRGNRERPAEREPDRPNIIVLHADNVSDAQRAQRRSWSDVPCVVISTAKVDAPAADRSRYLQKPFCYRELIRLIEELLTRAARS